MDFPFFFPSLKFPWRQRPGRPGRPGQVRIDNVSRRREEEQKQRQLRSEARPTDQMGRWETMETGETGDIWRHLEWIHFEDIQDLDRSGFFWGLRVRPRAWFFALKRLCRMVFCENSKMCLLFTHTIWSTTSIAISVDHVQVKGSNRYGRYGLLQTTWAFDYPFKLNNWSPRPESMRIRNHTFCLYSVPISPVLRLVYQGNWGWQLRNYSKS